MVRVIQEQATPFNDATQNIYTAITSRLLASGIDPYRTKAMYSPENKFYIISNSDATITYCVDMRGQLEDGTHRVTEWPSFYPYSLCRTVAGLVMFGFAGVIGEYSGYLDNASTYRFVFRSGWMDLGEQNAVLKIGKRLKLLAYSPAGVTVTLKWFYDFKRVLHYAQITYVGDGADEYGTGDFGTAEYTGVLSQRSDYVPMDGSGQYILIGVETEVNGHPFAVQSLTAYYMPGRVA
jgi:hypothetical protein